MTLSKKLKLLRSYKGLTQEQIADRFGAVKIITKIEN